MKYYGNNQLTVFILHTDRFDTWALLRFFESLKQKKNNSIFSELCPKEIKKEKSTKLLVRRKSVP